MKSRHFILDNNYTFDVGVVERYDSGYVERAEVVATIPLQGTTLDHLNHIGQAVAQYAVDISDITSFDGVRVELGRRHGRELFYVIADISCQEHDRRESLDAKERYCLIQLDSVPVHGENTYIVPASWVAAERFEDVVHFEESSIDFMASEHGAAVFKPGCVSNCVDDIYTTANILYDLHDDGWLTQDWSAAFQPEKSA
tara:strand:- start:153 stop:749 length:597 start_codon:yes stop_codon:yes gene_type:complete